MANSSLDGESDGNPPFQSDSEAILHVRRMASLGSAYHKDALARLSPSWERKCRGLAVACPFCGENNAENLRFSIQRWTAHADDPANPNSNRLDEHQCDSCGRAFWT